ncbi:MAG: phenylalanine--tRNA ligase subunit beta [Dehalococcoidia bacterium]|nr:phenylalanine--tRNA ligase subunit beta [Dehalococcoidia bacterium]
MKLLLSWLREFVDVDLPIPELARRVIDATAEVEGWETIGADWDAERIRVAQVVAVEPHPNADRLRLATVETAAGRQQVVCGAPNLEVGQKVAFATEGAELVDGHTGERSKLKLRPIRGVDSAGMVLSEKELGLSDNHEGILVLPEDAPIGRPLVEQLGDVLFDISTWANRADLLGVLGLAREVAALTGKELREPDRSHGEAGGPVEERVAVEILDADLCRRFTASVIENVTIGPSPAWMQERLLRHGMRPINNVVDITNYVMLETGQPLHAFDYDLLQAKRMVARRARPGEHLVTLDDVERALDPDMLVICDGDTPVAIAGVMGGGNSEVNANTKTVLLEVANFYPGSIRRTSTLLKLRTEASARFEKGIGPDMAEFAQHRALHLFEQLTGGTVRAGIVDVYPGKQPPRTITLPASRIEQVLGIAIPADEVRSILAALGFTVRYDEKAAIELSLRRSRLDSDSDVDVTSFEVQPPYWRPDVEVPDDLVEDLGRIYGYDKLPATTLRGSLPPVEPRPVPELRERVRDLAAALGFQETISYTLTDEARLARVVDPADNRRRNPLGVMNPVAARHQFLRTSLRASVLETYANNRRHVDGALRLYEVAFEYLPVEADLPHERVVLCAALGGTREGRWARATGERLDFYDAKGAVEAILDQLGVVATFKPVASFGLLPGHTAEVYAGKEPVGIVAQVHPDTAAQFDIDEPVFLCELWVENLVRTLPERPAYTPPSRFPEVRLDVALLVDAETPAGRVLEIVRSHKSGSVRLNADIFDDYRGPGVPAGKKSLAVSLRYQAADRTLTDSDVEKVQGGLLKRLEKEVGAALRGG